MSFRFSGDQVQSEDLIIISAEKCNECCNRINICFLIVAELFSILVIISPEAVAPGVFCKKRVLKNFVKFAGKHLCRGHFLIKLQTFLFRQSKKT